MAVNTCLETDILLKNAIPRKWAQALDILIKHKFDTVLAPV